jgi:hypothetical protein
MTLRCLLAALLATVSCAQRLDDLAPFPCAKDLTCPGNYRCLTNTMTCQPGPSPERSDAGDAPTTMRDVAPELEPVDMVVEVAPLITIDAANGTVDVGVTNDGHNALDSSDGSPAEGPPPPPTVCSADGECEPSSYCASNKCVPKKLNGSQCVANDQCLTGACATYYYDGDRDGYGAEVMVTRCGSTAPAGGMVDYTDKPGDCCDKDPESHPGAGLVAHPNACQSWDNDCDKKVEKISLSIHSCCEWTLVKNPGGSSTGSTMRCIPTPSNPPTPPCFVSGPPAQDCGEPFDRKFCEGTSAATCGLKSNPSVVTCR